MRGGFRTMRTQKSHRSFRLRGNDVGEFSAFAVYRRLLLSGGAPMRDSARSLMVVFIACAPPVRELMGISAPTRLKSIAPGASTPGCWWRQCQGTRVENRWLARFGLGSSGFEIFADEGHF